jgi:hypothetical protein
MVLPITGVIFGTFLLAWVTLPWASVTAPSATGAMTRSAGTETPTSFTTDSSSIVVASPSLPKTTASSPFFEHVLEWKEVSASDYASNHTESDESGGSGHHYAAAIEFCSDPDTNSYGYGPVGGCVPGGPAPLIRMRPKTFYHLTLYNNGHIDTNVHTHGLHVSGVGTVDDVTRVAKPGECLTYDVSGGSENMDCALGNHPFGTIQKELFLTNYHGIIVCFLSMNSQQILSTTHPRNKTNSVFHSRRRRCWNLLVPSPPPPAGHHIGLRRGLRDAHRRRDRGGE